VRRLDLGKANPMFTNPQTIQSHSQPLLDYRAVTGRHDAHFLRRVDRLAPTQADFALALYRDHELIKVLLSQLRVSDSVERVAISLKDATSGPFIVVARNGHFVTCLGEGMRVSNIPVVTKSEFDQVARRVQRVRNVMQDVALHPRREVEKALKRLFECGPDVSREEFNALAAWQPLLAPTFLQIFLKLPQRLAATYHLLAFRQSAFKHRDESALRDYYRQSWALAHLAMLLGTDGGEFLRSLSSESFFPELASALTYPLARLNVASHAIRGTWLASKIGEPMLLPLRDEYLSTRSPLRMIDAGMALSAMGHAHRNLQPEIDKVLQSEQCAENSLTGFASSMRPIFASHFRAGLTLPDAAQDQLGLLLQAPSSVIDADFAMLRHILTCLPSLARAKAGDFYMPRRYLDRSRRTASLASAIQLIEPRRWHDRLTGAFARLRPRPRSERVPRNVTCPCGSQKKFKRCCLRGAAALN
jgi:hypothetical protein